MSDYLLSRSFMESSLLSMRSSRSNPPEAYTNASTTGVVNISFLHSKIKAPTERQADKDSYTQLRYPSQILIF